MAGGRSAREPMERLVRLATVLHAAGARGVPTSTLVEAAAFTGEGDPVSQLGREFRHLREQGWQIENIGGPGDSGRYRMTTVDNRLAVSLTPGQRAALRRAVLLADRGDLLARLGLDTGAGPSPGAEDRVPPLPPPAPEQGLAPVIDAVRRSALLRFRYAGRERTVHPAAVRAVGPTWYLSGTEDGSDLVKSFVVSRMAEVRVDTPSTARRPAATRHPGLHPMTWEVDPPVEVTLRCAPEFGPDVRRWLGDPLRECGDSATPEVTLVYRVTNREALRSRIYQLGTRVTLVGPDEVRRELLEELSSMAGQ